MESIKYASLRELLVVRFLIMKQCAAGGDQVTDRLRDRVQFGRSVDKLAPKFLFKSVAAREPSTAEGRVQTPEIHQLHVHGVRVPVPLTRVTPSRQLVEHFA